MCQASVAVVTKRGCWNSAHGEVAMFRVDWTPSVGYPDPCGREKNDEGVCDRSMLDVINCAVDEAFCAKCLFFLSHLISAVILEICPVL